LKTLPKLFLRVNRLYLDKGAREISDYNEIDEAGIYNTTGKKNDNSVLFGYLPEIVKI
jgi:hypothetical protein